MNQKNRLRVRSVFRQPGIFVSLANNEDCIIDFRRVVSGRSTYRQTGSDLRSGYEAMRRNLLTEEEIEILGNCASEFLVRERLLEPRNEDRLRLRARQGDAWAEYLLGQLYFMKATDAWPDESAVIYLWRSADQGNHNAQYLLGNMYATGRGVEKNVVSAAIWFNLSAVQGNEDAQRSFELIAEEMTPKQMADARGLPKMPMEVFRRRLDDIEHCVIRDVLNKGCGWSRRASPGNIEKLIRLSTRDERALDSGGVVSIALSHVVEKAIADDPN